MSSGGGENGRMNFESFMAHSARAATLGILGLLTWAIVTLNEMRVQLAVLQTKVVTMEQTISRFDGRIGGVERELRRSNDE